MIVNQTADEQVPAPTAWVRERREEAADLAESLVAFDTQNPPGHTEDVVAWLEARAEEWGIDNRRVVSDPSKPNLLLTVPGASSRTLLFNGHLDTVPYHAPNWTYDPLGERVDDRIYGRGAEDMKGPIAAFLLAARAFVETDTEPPVTLAFALVADEETDATAGTETFLEQGGIDPEVCVVGETTSTPERQSVTVAERGRMWLTVVATGESAHGSRPMFGINAIDLLDDAVDECRATLADYRLSTDPALDPVIEETVDYYAPAMGYETAREMFERPTVNLGTFNGGEAVNSVPARAVAELDIRLSPGVDPTAVLPVVCRTFSNHDRVRVQDIASISGTYESPDSPVVDPAVEAVRRVTGQQVYRRCASGGSDARLFRNADVPTVEVGLGVGNAHATDEFTTVETVVGNAAVYSLLPLFYG